MAIPALEALEQLKAALINGGLETPADGFKTIADWAKETGQSIANTGKVLREGVNSGLVEKADYRVRAGQIVRVTTHYRIIPVRVSRKAKK